MVVLTGLQAGWSFSVSKDRKRLLHTQELYYSNLWLGRLDGSGENQRITPTPLTTGTASINRISVSPDGAWIAFAREDPTGTNIYKMPIAGGSPQQLTFLKNAYSEAPVWSPDGKRIAFGSNHGGAVKVWVVSSEGGLPRQFAKSELSELFQLAWAPGKEILYQRPGNRNLYILDPNTQEERPLVKDDSVGWMFSPCISPDGSRVAVMWNRRPGGVWVIPHRRQDKR